MKMQASMLMSLAVAANLALAMPQAPDANADPMSLPIWQSELIYTHNSYAKKDPGILIPGTAGPAYEKGLDGQMDLGVRVLEIDIFTSTDDHKDGEITHSGTTDTHCGHISECLKQIHAWSTANPDHSPIVVFWEIQNESLAEIGDLKPKKEHMHNAIKGLANQLDIIRGEGMKTISYADAGKPMNELRGQVLHVAFRKKGGEQSIWGAWPRGAEEVDEYMVKKDIFLSGREMNDNDPDWVNNAFPNTIRILKQDHVPATAPDNVFVTSTLCNDRDRCKKDLGTEALNTIGAANGLGVSDIFMIDPDTPAPEEIAANHGLKVLNDISLSADKVLVNESRLANVSTT